MKLLALLLSLVFASAPAFAQTNAIEKAREFRLNKASPQAMAESQLGTQVYKNSLRVLTCTYNFATHGGAVSTINLDAADGSDCKLPSGAIVLNAFIDEVTNVTSGGAATIALGTGQATTDVKAATAIASYDGVALASAILGAAANIVKLTADRTPSITIATAALTAGKINVIFTYVVSE